MLIAVLAAIAAGSAFAVSSVLQQRAARSMPQEESLSPRLLVHLLRRPDWLLGMGSALVSFGLQALALAYGPIALVQPLIVCELLFAVPISVRLARRRLGAREWAGTIAVAGGLAAFLVAADPLEGTSDPDRVTWLLILCSVAGCVGLALSAGRALSGPARASLFAVAAGVTFGLQAALTKTVTHLVGQGPEVLFTGWQLYALAVVGLFGLLLGQSAFQAGPLAASLPVLDVVEPISAICIGVAAFGEQISVAPVDLGLEVGGLLLLVAGVVALDTSPLVVALQDLDDVRAPEPQRQG